jgi:chitinase
MSAPAAGTEIRGVVTLRVNVSAPAGVVGGVSFFANGQELASDATAPYTATWDTRVSYPDQPVTLRAAAYYGNAEQIVSAPVNVHTANLSISLSSPAAGAIVHGLVTLVAVTTADSEATFTDVRFLIDGTEVGRSYLPPWSAGWDSRHVPNGRHVLSARARTMDGRSVVTADRTITVRN